MYTDNVTDTALVEGLRNFFLAQGSLELEQSFAQIADSCGKAPAIEDWQEVEFVFNRLFVGPAALEAPPYASVYLDPEPVLMGKTTMTVREMYAAIGLESPWKNELPDDHISLELDAALAMNHLAAGSELKEMKELRNSFIAHMKSWVPGFIDRIRAASSGHRVIGHAADCLEKWLSRQDDIYLGNRQQGRNV